MVFPFSFSFANLAALSIDSLSCCLFRRSFARLPCAICSSSLLHATFFEWPKFNVGTQSTFHLSQEAAGFPCTKCRLQTLPLCIRFSVKPSLLMADNHLLRRSIDSSSQASPWFFTMTGTRKKEISLSRTVLEWQFTIKHKTMMKITMFLCDI